jgi:lipid-A-disaccharide synthase
LNLIFSAGEASGDAYAAELAKRLREFVLLGIGGARSSAAGVQLIADSSDWGAIGIIESLKVGPRVQKGYRLATQALNELKPGVFVPIDFGFLNIQLARHARAKGWKVLYFMPPGSWRKDKQGKDLPSVTDRIVTPFPWSAEILKGMGATVDYFGHPLAQMVQQRGVETRLNQLALLPGSREHEIRANMPVLAKVAQELKLPVEVALAESVQDRWVADEWRKAGGDPDSLTLTRREPYGVLLRSKAAVVCSGTATLEAALCRCPFVVVYRLSAMVALEGRIRRPKFDYIALPNIIAGKAVVPELIDKDASVQRVVKKMEGVLSNDGEKQLAEFDQLASQITGDDPLGQTADCIRQLAAAAE